jgi:kojibiose phosphorylase
MNPYLFEETSLDPAATKHYEGAFAQGSGYVHIRGSFEEGLAAAPQDESYMRLPANVTIEKPRHPRSKWGTYVPGITGFHPLLREELVNLPNPLWFCPIESGERLDMDESRIEGYCRALNMRNGLLTRRFVWHTKSGARIFCTYERFISMKRKNLILQRITFEALEGIAKLSLCSTINEKVRTNGYDHFASVEKQGSPGKTMVTAVTDTGDKVTIVSMLACGKGCFAEENGLQTLRMDLVPGESVTVIKGTVIATSREECQAAMEPVPMDYQALFEESAACWEKLWRKAEVIIEGDEKVQQAVNFSIYHLLRSASRDDDRIAVCAKGFAGEAYFGHFFWDTEIYLLPFFLYNFPETAKNLVSFRIRTLNGAMRNAGEYGYTGARYPWESSVSGLEQCPNWQYADHEIHVTADVAFGLWHYYKATQDTAFLLRAAPVFVETARYWLDRVYIHKDGSVFLNGVMGPDEYVLICDNNAYTNFMVHHALSCTLEVLRTVRVQDPAAYETLHINNEFLEKVNDVANRLNCLVRDDGVILQCEGFEKLEEPDFAKLWPDRSRHFGANISQERNYRTKALKQADVLMLPYLFPSSFTKEQVEKNLSYYMPYTTHDSSLSAIVHAILLARLGQEEEAYAFFERALDIDLQYSGGGAAEGIHIANCGGIWQAIMTGFAGMRFAYEADTPAFAPRLPKHWKKLSFHLIFGKYAYDVTIEGKDVHLTRRDPE